MNNTDPRAPTAVIRRGTNSIRTGLTSMGTPFARRCSSAAVGGGDERRGFSIGGLRLVGPVVVKKVNFFTLVKKFFMCSRHPPLFCSRSLKRAEEEQRDPVSPSLVISRRRGRR